METQTADWSSASELKDASKKYYAWPQFHLLREGEEQSFYPSVTEILGASVGFAEAKQWFMAEGVVRLAQAAGQKESVRVWHKDTQQAIDVKPTDILMNRLPKDLWPSPVAGIHEIKALGAAEMTKRANRGTVVHDAFEEFGYGLVVEDYEIEEYTRSLIARPRRGYPDGFALETDYCVPFVQSCLSWARENVAEVLMSEAWVFNETYCYAGALDSIVRLKDHDGTWQIDLKNTTAGAQYDHGLQQSAYYYAERVGIKGTRNTVPFERPDHVANLYIEPGKATLREWGVGKDYTLEDLFTAFLHERMAWQYREAGALPVTIKAPKITKPKPETVRKGIVRATRTKKEVVTCQ